MLSTRTKVRIAYVLYHLLRALGVRDSQLVKRSGIQFRLDLREGIDLSIFLFGGFQSAVADVSIGDASPVILDVGANIGAIALPLAKRHPLAHVHCFEPTHFAISKLRENVRLNPELAERIIVNHTFVGSASGTMPQPKTYASWRIDGDQTGSRHSAHMGALMDATDAVTSLDDYVEANRIERVHLLKIDTDGHEMGVLRGCQRLLQHCRPLIVMEVCPYLLEEQGVTLASFKDLLEPLGYALTDIRSGRVVDERLLARMPYGGSIDVLASPREP